MSNNGLEVEYYYFDKENYMRGKNNMGKKVDIDYNIGVGKNNIEVEDYNGKEEGSVDYKESRRLFKGFENPHNCYAYAFLYSFTGNLNKGKPQPGEFSLINRDSVDKCYNYYKLIKHDNPHIYTSYFNNNHKCPKPFFKIFFTKENGYGDYHFYKLDKSGYWSHKPGTTNIRYYDHKNKFIKNPLHAYRNLYKIPCFFACINPLFSRTTSY